MAPTPARPPRYTLSSAAPTTATRAPPPPPHERIIGHLREHFHNNGSLARMFLQWDADRNGRLSVGELARLVASQGVSATPDDIAAVHRAMRQASSSSGDDAGDVRFHQFAGLLQPPGDDDGAVARSGLPLPCREVERVAAARRTAPPTRSARVAPLFQEPDARRLARRVVTTLSDRMRRLAVPSAAIRSWDTRHRGVVTGDDCRRALARYNIDLTDAELAAFLAEFVAGAGADDDDDGVPVERIVTHLFQDDDVDDDVQRYRPWRASRRVASAGAQRPVEAADLDQVDVVLGRLARVRRASTRALFRYLDENGDGVIDRDDLRARMTAPPFVAAPVSLTRARPQAGGPSRTAPPTSTTCGAASTPATSGPCRTAPSPTWSTAWTGTGSTATPASSRTASGDPARRRRPPPGTR